MQLWLRSRRRLLLLLLLLPLLLLLLRLLLLLPLLLLLLLLLLLPSSYGVFCWLTIPNGPAHSQMRSFMGIVSFFWRQTRDSGLAASELEIFSHKFAFGAVCVKQSSICIGLEAAT